MKVTVAGVHRYSVKIPKKSIVDESGDELDGMAIESARLILISPRVTPERREELLHHEIQHAWEFHVPSPRTEEERCQLAATIAQQYRHDIEAAGGIQSLMSLQPTEVRLPFSPGPIQRESDAANTFRVLDFKLCGVCDSPTMCGSIENGPVEFHQGLSQHQVLRWFKCEICAALNVWREVATSDGRPTGVLVQVPAPKVLTGREAAEWIAENATLATR